MIVASFDKDFRSLSAQAFADILAQRLNVQALVLGDDFKFGHDRSGDSQFLRDYGLHVTNLDTVTDSSHKAARISSTRIRDLLLAGDINAANALLGRDYAITGTVVGGDKIGRTLDFPTANINLKRIKPALHGIFAVDVVSLDEDGKVIPDGLVKRADNDHRGIAGLRANSLFGTANIGTRPSVDKKHEWRLEVHFPELQADLYLIAYFSNRFEPFILNWFTYVGANEHSNHQSLLPKPHLFPILLAGTYVGYHSKYWLLSTFLLLPIDCFQ